MTRHPRIQTNLIWVMVGALGLDEDYFARLHTHMFDGKGKNATTFRTLFYPSLKDSDVQAGVERLGAHSDYGTITLLFQDDIGGLEVTSRQL